MNDYDLVRRCDVLEILDYEGFLGRTRKLVEQLVAVTPEAQAAEIETDRGQAMTDAPERIWVWPDYNDHFNPVKQDWTHGFWDSTEGSLGTEYVRVDHIKAQAAEIERLRVDLKRAVSVLEQAKVFIDDQYACSESQALNGEYVSKAARPIWNALCIALAELTGDNT